MTQQQRDKVQAILAKGLPIRTAQTISTPRLTNSTVPTTTTSTGFCASRRRPQGPSASVHKHGKLLEIVDEVSLVSGAGACRCQLASAASEPNHF